MNDQTLKNLLGEADRRISRPTVAADLRERVFTRVHRRRAVRRGIGVILVIVSLLPLLRARRPIARTPNNPPAVVASVPKPSPWDAVVERRTIEAILRLQNRPTLVRSLALDPLQRLRMESDVTAATLLAAGDHYARNPASAGRGAENYQRVKTYFPKTPWAAQADQRLSQIRS